MAKRAKKQAHLQSKEEVIAALKQNAAFMDKMKFIKERFWPALCAAATSIEDAQQLLSGFNTQLMQEFLADMRTKKMEDIKMAEKLDKESPKYAENIALLDIFKEMNVLDCKDYIEGMKTEIGLFLKEENEVRPLVELKTKWMDEQ